MKSKSLTSDFRGETDQELAEEIIILGRWYLDEPCPNCLENGRRSRLMSDGGTAYCETCGYSCDEWHIGGLA